MLDSKIIVLYSIYESFYNSEFVICLFGNYSQMIGPKMLLSKVRRMTLEDSEILHEDRHIVC